MSMLDQIKQHALVYFATPYSKYPMGIHMAFVDSCLLTAKLLRAGVNVYSPIAHTHPIATYGNIDPLSHDIWLNFDNTMLNVSEALIIATGMEGWPDSKGIAYEIDFFKKLNKPIYYPFDDFWKGLE